MSKYDLELNTVEAFLHYIWPMEVWDEITTYCSVCGQDIKKDGHKPGCAAVVASALFKKIREALKNGERAEAVAYAKETSACIASNMVGFDCDECGQKFDANHEPWCLAGLALDALERIITGEKDEG